ncbi:MAG: PucR family transcriptional regulator ligand-binding domain-containing protein [Clostridia bacterium]
MSLTLSKLCKNTEKMYDLKLIAGTGGMENVVRWVHMVEDTEVPEFLHGDELVFTTGIANYQENWLLNFVKNLQANNACGVVINIGPYIQTIPPKVIVYCEQNNFPIFTIPWETRIIDITYAFCRIIIADEKTEQSLTEAFKNLILDPQNTNGYQATLEKNGFSNLSNYTVMSLCVKSQEKDVTSKFVHNHSTDLSKILKLNSQPKCILSWNKSLNIIYQNVHLNALEQLPQKLEMLDKSCEIHIGVSQTQKEFCFIKELYKQAKFAQMVSEFKQENFYYYREIGVYKMLLNIDNIEVLKDFYFETLGKLIKYDETNNTDLYSSLKKYCEYNGSVFELASQTGVHRNTINNKMRKIREVMEKEIDYQTIMELMLCFHISQIINYKK